MCVGFCLCSYGSESWGDGRKGETVGFRLRNSEARKSVEDQLDVDHEEVEGRPRFVSQRTDKNTNHDF